MPISTCRGCDETFTGVGPFDAHQKAINIRPFVMCLEPSKVGLVQNDGGRWGSADGFAETYIPAAERPAADYLVDCRDCGKEFERPRGRGRPPVRCPECKAK